MRELGFVGVLVNGSGSSGQLSFDPVLGRVYASSDRGQLYALRLEDDLLEATVAVAAAAPDQR